MADSFAFDVFISHSSKDKAVVRPLAERLRAYGLKVWYDDFILKPGDSIPAKIEEGLENSRGLVLCMSANAFGSDWAQMESYTFRFRDPLKKERRFIPLRLDDAPIKGSLAQFLYINWRTEEREEYLKLLVACRSPALPPQLSEEQGLFIAQIISLGHTDAVNSAAFSPDGKQALSASDDNTVRLWNLADGKCLRVLEGHAGSVLSVAWSPDGTQALSASGDKTVRLWNLADGKCLRVLEGHAGYVFSAAWSPDGTQALSASTDNTVRLWNLADGKCLRVLEGHADSVNSAAWSPDGTQALSASDDNTVRLWNLADGKCLRVLEGHDGYVLSVAWSPDGKQALSASGDKTVRLWNLADGKCLRVLEGHDRYVLSVAWSPDGTQALSASDDNTVRLWNLADGKCLRVLEGHDGYVLSAAWSPDGTQALSASTDNTVRLWNLADGKCLRVLEGHADSVFSAAWSPDGKQALSASDDNTVRLWNLADGKCLRVLKGHDRYVFSAAWSPDGTQALFASGDKTVRLWNLADGKCLRVLEGHAGSVNSAAWSPDGKQALSASDDNTVRLWNLADGKCLRVLKGHDRYVFSAAWSPDGRQALSASRDQTVRLWNLADGKCLRVLEGHAGYVNSAAWSPDGTQALSASDDNTVRLWNLADGKCLRVLEGHADSVNSVAWSPDGTQALSASGDKTVRLWNLGDGKCLRVLEGHADSVRSAAWSPDGRTAYSAANNGVMRIWDLSEPARETPSLPEQLLYTNAKVLLVGDTGVGKSGLAERLVHKRFIPTKSSHARKAHVLESQIVQESGGVSLHQETVLWDLAGQPAYRLVHQLSMEDAALACVLFDCRNETNPFEAAAYWSQVLDQSRTTVKRFLIAARIDVGGLPAGKERIETFARENDFTKFIPTSASTGEGCEELLEAIRQGIPWGELPKVTTTDTLAMLREYVAGLKGEKDEYPVVAAKLFTIAELHEGFGSYFGKKIFLEEFIAHLERLEATDAVDLLVFHTTGAVPHPEDRVLLDPTRVDAYASALLVAAKDEPDGPGHLLESRVREGNFKLDQEERLVDPECERHVLWFVMENLLSRDLALRERIRGEDYFVFPSQCTAELRFPGAAAFGVAFGFAGAVRSIYATLIAQLAHYEGFKKREFFQDAAAYTTEEGGRCLIRLRDHGRGLGELELFFDSRTPASVRQGFLEFVGKHLEVKSKPGSVTKRHDYHCANPKCGEPFDDRVVKANLAARQKDLLCPFCRKTTPLVNLLIAPTVAAASIAAKIDTDAKAGRQRMTAALVIKAKEAQRQFDIFLSHNSQDKVAVEKIAKRLLSVGIRPWLDKWNLSPGDTVSDSLEQAIKTIPCAALCFGPADVGRWHILEIRAYVEKWASGDARMIPVILSGVNKTPELPLFVRQTLWVDMRNWEQEKDDSFYRLVCGILGRAPGDSPMKKFRARDVAKWQGMNF